MDMAYILGGSYPHIAKMRIGESVSQGVPLVGAMDGESGAQEISNTAFVNVLGVCQEDVTYSTTQATDGSDLDRVAACIINSDAVWKAKLSGGATEGTLLPVATVDTADSAGLSVETDVAMTIYDNGTIWGLTGANKGQVRKIDEISGAHASVLVPFLAVAVGDTFLVSPFHQGGPTLTVELTTLMTEVNNAADPTSNIPMTPIDLLTNGRGDSFMLFMFRDHAFAADQT